MKTKLYLVRHGQSEGNLKKSFLGHTDLDLTDLGRLQAQKTAEYLTTVRPDAIYSSDLKRAANTALPTADYWKMPIQRREELREIFAGKWENLTFAHIEETYPSSWRCWIDDLDHARCDGGESVMELQKRFSKEILRLGEKHLGETVFVFSHATPIRSLAAFCGYRPTIREVPWPNNASVSEFCYENGALSLVRYSFDDFMGDLSTGLSGV